MITDKDKEYAVVMTKIWIRDSEGGQLKDLAGIISRIRTKSADQARKEAAEIAVAFVDNNMTGLSDCDIGLLTDLRAAILGDSTADHIPDTGKKLAIAVKALEDIKEIGKAGPAFETHFSKLQYIGAVTNDALREIQG